MAFTLVQSNEGTSTLATTSPTFASTPTAGNLIILKFASDDYNATPNTGWTQSTGMEQQTFHGGYIWWQISTGAQPPSYTIGSATNSAWILEEWSGNDPSPYDTSNGTFAQSSGLTQATPTITPSAGERLLCVAMGGSLASTNVSAVTVSWSNSFTTIRDTGNSTTSGTSDWIGAGYRLVTGDGATGYTTTGTISGITPYQSRSGLIISFKAAPVAQDGPAFQGDAFQGDAFQIGGLPTTASAATGSAAGTGTASAVGAATAAAAGSATGSGTATAADVVTKEATGSAAGTGSRYGSWCRDKSCCW
jgi:hypothetical protein